MCEGTGINNYKSSFMTVFIIINENENSSVNNKTNGAVGHRRPMKEIIKMYIIECNSNQEFVSYSENVSAEKCVLNFADEAVKLIKVDELKQQMEDSGCFDELETEE